MSMKVGIAAILFLLLGPLHAQDRPELEVMKDITYGTAGGVELKLDLARPRSAEGPLPAVLCIHGGAWAGGKRQDMWFLAERLARHGYVAATASYRLAPAHPFPAQVEDVKCAVRFLRSGASRFHIDPERVGAVGASAGGHLACILGTTEAQDGLEGSGGLPGVSSRVQAVVNFFGPTDLTRKGFSDVSEGLIARFIGGRRAERGADYRRASPLAYLTADDAPVITFHGTVDPLVPYDQAVLLHRRMDELGIPNRLVTMEGYGHGWVGPDLERSIAETLAFLERRLRGRPAERV